MKNALKLLESAKASKDDFETQQEEVKNFNTFGEHAANLFTQKSTGPVQERLETDQQNEPAFPKRDTCERPEELSLNMHKDSQNDGSVQTPKLAAELRQDIVSPHVTIEADTNRKPEEAKEANPYVNEKAPQIHYSGSFGVPDSPLSDRNRRKKVQVAKIRVLHPGGKDFKPTVPKSSVYSNIPEFELINMSFSQQSHVAGEPKPSI